LRCWYNLMFGAATLVAVQITQFLSGTWRPNENFEQHPGFLTVIRFFVGILIVECKNVERYWHQCRLYIKFQNGNIMRHFDQNKILFLI
jgi:hypothetical protein